MSRVGLGVDAHAFAEGRRLVLGGVNIPHPRGLAGHSDADVVAHALCDALLGAASLGDIGEHFPDSDPRLEGADGMELLGEVARMVGEKGLAIDNADVTVVAEEPRLAPHREGMRANLAKAMGVGVGQVGVKATTTEGMGMVGRKEGIVAVAVALVSPR